MSILSQGAIRHAWYSNSGRWLGTISGCQFRVDFKSYQNHPATSVKLTIVSEGGLSGDETLAIIDAAHKAVGAPLNATVEHDFQSTTITWDVKGPKAPRGAGKETKQPKKRKRTKKKGSELVPIYDI